MKDSYSPFETMIRRWKASQVKRRPIEDLVDNVKFCNGDIG